MLPFWYQVQCVYDIAEQLFFKTTEDLNYFKATLSSAVGADLPVLIDMVPLLEKLFPYDECPKEKIDVSPAEAEERTLRILQNFLSCVAFDDRPLVLFIDDLQWSSSAESSVWAGLVSSFRSSGVTSSVRNCLLIISYRINEVPEGILQILSKSLDKVRRRSGQSETHGALEIQVGPLHLVYPLRMTLIPRWICRDCYLTHWLCGLSREKEMSRYLAENDSCIFPSASWNIQEEIHFSSKRYLKSMLS